MPPESSLYPPIRDFLKTQGFEVHAEAHHCDVVGKREEELVVVEMKNALTLDLLAQGLQRLKLTDSVYVAIPEPSPAAEIRVRALYPILRKLELGLLTVDTLGHVAVRLQPTPFQRRREPKRRKALLTELSGRSGEDNIGGVRGRKIMTAYRENAVFVAVALRRFGESRPRDLRKLGTGPKTLPILADNVYGWFDRVGRGMYGLSPKGVQELSQWESICQRKEALLPEKISP